VGSTLFEAVIIDPLERQPICVKPYPQFAPLFRMDGMEEDDGCFYWNEEGQEAGPTD